MDKFKDMLKGKDTKAVANLATAIAFGILLIICGTTFFSSKVDREEKTKKVEKIVENTKSETKAPIGYEQLLESRLKHFLETVEGVGKVEVMITLENGREIVVAEDITNNKSATKETDSEGGSREANESNSQTENIIVSGKDGYQEPLILKEIEPEIEGVIISAQGGDNVYIESELINATQTVLGVEPHKVQILKMK